MGNSAQVENELWSYLVQGQVLPKDVQRLGGRLDLRNLRLPEPRKSTEKNTPVAGISHLTDITEIRDASWQSIDFSMSNMPSLRFYDANVSDCIFDGCSLRDLRAWSTTFSNVTFRSADLRGAVLGGVLANKTNVFRNVDFSGADLRKTIYVAATFVGCNFKNSKLEKIDFQSSAFENCTFDGELREVIFNSRGFKGERFPRNQMKNVDLSRANLRQVEFRGLNLDEVRFPHDDKHILVRDFPSSLERLIAFFQMRSDPGSKQLAAMLMNKRKWLGERQSLGVFSNADILQLGGEIGLSNFIEVIKGGHPV